MRIVSIGVYPGYPTRGTSSFILGSSLTLDVQYKRSLFLPSFIFFDPLYIIVINSL